MRTKAVAWVNFFVRTNSVDTDQLLPIWLYKPTLLYGQSLLFGPALLYRPTALTSFSQGTVSTKDLGTLLRALGKSPTQEELQKLFNDVSSGARADTRRHRLSTYACLHPLVSSLDI